MKFILLFFLLKIIGIINIDEVRAISIHQVSLSMGQYQDWVGSIQKSPHGKNSSLTDFADCLTLKCPLNPSFKAALDFSLADIPNMPSLAWYLRSELGYVSHYPLWNEDYSKHQFMLSLLTYLEWQEKWSLGLGTTMMIQSIYGDGSEILLDNANDQSVFYQPDENRLAFNQTLDLYVSYQFHPRWSTHIQQYIYRPFNQDLRQYSIGLFLNYRWDINEFYGPTVP